MKKESRENGILRTDLSWQSDSSDVKFVVKGPSFLKLTCQMKNC